MGCTKIIYDLLPEKLFMGYGEEQLSRTLTFDISQMQAELPGGVPMIAYMRPRDELGYLASGVTLEGSTLTWELSAHVMQYKGIGGAQIVLVDESGEETHILKSHVMQMLIGSSIPLTGGEPPEPWETWLEQILAAAARAESAAADAEAQADRAETAEAGAQQALIDAGSPVLYGRAQTLTDTQQQTARGNIAAASAADVSDLKSAATKIPEVEVMRNALTINGSSNVMSEILTLGDLGDRSGKPYLPTFVSRVFVEPYLRFSFDVKITCPNTYYFRVYFYNDGVFDRLISWTRNLTIPAYQQFRIVMRNYPEDTSITADPATFANNLSFSVVSSAGDQTYQGEKVNLAPDLTKQNNCSIQLWKDFTNTDDAWKLYDAQSMDIYDGKMFIFTSDGVANVLDMTSKEIIATFATDSSVHFNSVQFSNIFYSANDKYPLLFVVYTPYVNVYRLTESNSVFNISFINRINISFQQHGGSMSIDSGLRLLNIALYKNGEYSVYSDNPCAFYSFRLPSDADILSGTEIQLTYADVIAGTETDHATLQDAKAKNGITYQCVSNDSESSPRQFVWCINNKNSSLQTIIRLLVNLEVEGIAIDGRTMYVAQRRGSSSGNTNPLKIYSVTF